MSKIMEMADKCIATYAWHGTTDYMIVDDGKARDTLAAAIQAEQDYTRAVISEREALRKELAELRLQVISDIGQEIES
jgi:protease II